MGQPLIIFWGIIEMPNLNDNSNEKAFDLGFLGFRV
jgi:hypothetical protein